MWELRIKHRSVIIQVALVIRGLFICEFPYSQLVKIYQNLVYAVFWFPFPHLFAVFYEVRLKIALKSAFFWPFRASSLFGVSVYAVLRQNVSTANYENKFFYGTMCNLKF